MRRVAAAKFGKRQPESDRAGPSLPPGRRSLHGQKIGRATPPRYRAGFAPPRRPRQARPVIRGGPAKQVERAWEVQGIRALAVRANMRSILVVMMKSSAISNGASPGRD